MKPYIGLYIANRLGNWDLRIASLKGLLPLFHAFDHPNYSRILPWHIYHMSTLPDYILQHFKEGGFAVSQTGSQGNQLMLDEAHESLINKDTKHATKSLAPGRLLKFESICRFLPVRATVLSNLKKEICRNQETNEVQKGYYTSTIRKEEANIQAYASKFSQAEAWHFEKLKPLFTNAPSDGHEMAREHDLMNYRQIGKEAAEQYILSHILQKPSAHPPQRAKKLKTFHKPVDTKKKLKRSLKHQHDQLQLYKTELIMQQHGEEIGKEMLGQVWEAPLSLSEADSDMPYKGTKAALKSWYKSRYTKPPVLPTSFPLRWKPEAIILEGMNMIYTPPNHMIHQTFDQYTHHLLQFYAQTHLLQGKVREVHIVFDNVLSSSITPKLMERSRRDAKGNVIVDVENEQVDDIFDAIEDQTCLPSDWEKFL